MAEAASIEPLSIPDDVAALVPEIWPAHVHPLALLGAGLLSPKGNAAKRIRALQQFRARAVLWPVFSRVLTEKLFQGCDCNHVSGHAPALWMQLMARYHDPLERLHG